MPLWLALLGTFAVVATGIGVCDLIDEARRMRRRRPVKILVRRW